MTANSLDSTFCKHCGTGLPEDELTAGKEKLEALVMTGFDLLKDGRAEEAMLIADSAVRENPSSAAAASLKGMCHEGRGEVAEALECYEQVVALKPDSALDKIKVNQLRNMMVAKVSSIPAAPDRKGAMLVAAAVAALVIVGGILVIRALNKPTVVASNDTHLPMANTMTESFDTPRVQPTAAAQTPVPQATQTPIPSPSTDPTGDLPHLDGTGLPDARNGAGEVPPFPVDSTTVPPTGANNHPGTGRGDGPIIDPPSPKPPAPTATPNPEGQISVTIHGQKNGGSSPPVDPASRANGLQAVLGAARSNFQLGKWGEAAQNFERAITMGGGRASTFQRLGDCYSHLGQSSKAITAYTSAVDAYDAQGETTGADACRAAIKSLKGN